MKLGSADVNKVNQEMNLENRLPARAGKGADGKPNR